MFGGDDDDDFMPAKNSKLASLFSSKSIVEGNTSLTYTAPKQPKRGGKYESRTSTKAPSVTEGSHKSSTSQTATNKLGIIIVKAVNTYKLEDGNYVLQGKLGAAVLGNAAVCVYQLLLYKGKQHHITSTIITPEFQFTVQENNYGTFYDGQKQNWSIHFEQKEDAEEFAREIGLARVNSQGGMGEIQSLLTQELYMGEGPAANLGDSMEIFYSVRLFSENKLGQIVENNLQGEKAQRVKLRKNVWEEGLIGATKGSKRIVMLPPSLLGPWKQMVSPDASLVVEVEVSRLKVAKTSRAGTPNLIASLVDSSESAVDSSTDETSIKARGASISEALTASPKTHKANIISRMAKMGQATLPLKGAITCNPSDTEDSEEEGHTSPKPPIIFKPSPKIRSTKTFPATHAPEIHSSGHTNMNKPPQPMAVYQPLPGWQQQPPQTYTIGQYGISQLDGQLYPMVPTTTISSHQLMSSTPAGTPTGIPSADSHLSVFMSETRMQNTEVRIGMAKVADKVDLVLSKLDSVQSVRPSMPSALLDSASLLASIQRLVTDNEQLKTELSEKGMKIDVQNDRIYQLLNTNHKYLEQSNTSNNDQRNHEALMTGLQREKVQLTEELNESRGKVQTLLAQLERFKEENGETMATQLASRQEEMTRSKLAVEERDTNIKVLTNQLKTAVEERDAHELTISNMRKSMLETQGSNDNLKESLSELMNLELQKMEANEKLKKLNARYSAQLEAAEAELQLAKLTKNIDVEQKHSEPASNKVFIDEVRKIMNVVYKALNREFANGETYLGEVIKETLVNTLRDVTYQFIERETFSTPLQSSRSVAGVGQQRKAHSETRNTETSEEKIAKPVASNADVVGYSKGIQQEQKSASKEFSELMEVSSELLSRSFDSLASEQDAAPADNGSSTSSITQIQREAPVVPSDNQNPTAEGQQDIGNSLSSNAMTNYMGGNAGDIIQVPLAKLQGETDLSAKLLPTTSETIPDIFNNHRVTSDPCVLGPLQTPRMRDDNRHETMPAIVQGAVPTSTDTLIVEDGQQLQNSQEGETIDKNLRESSLERKPWRSEPPPLFDDDEDEDDWLS